VFGETAGGVTVACVQAMLTTGALDATAETVILNTGDGLKTLGPVAEVVGPSVTIEPSLKSARQAGLLD
jgi:threonine synthase